MPGCSLVLTLRVLEAGFRFLGIAAYVRPHEHVFERNDDGPQLRALGGFVPLALHRTCYFTDPRGYFGPKACVDHRFNSAGWRDAEHTLVKPPGMYRILALGDSYLMGQGVHREHVFLARAVAELNTRDIPARVEAVNTGISGRNTAQEAQLLELRGLDYDPDLVLVSFVPNDVEEDLTAAGPLIEFYRNYTSISESADLLSQYSRVWKWGRETTSRRATARRYIRECVSAFESDSTKWAHCGAALERVFATCREHNLHVLVVVWPFFHELNADYPFQPIHDRVRAFCDQRNVPCLDLREAYREFSGPELWVHPTDQHPNEDAHAIAGRVLADAIETRRDELQIGARPAPRHTAEEEGRLQAHARAVQLGGVFSEDGTLLSFAGRPLTDDDARLMADYWDDALALHSVSWSSTRVGDETLAAMMKRDGWRLIDLSDTQVTVSGIALLSTQVDLEQLGLAGLPIDDAAMAHLAPLENLRVLNLHSTPITAASSDVLAGFRQLQTLVLTGTELDFEALRQLIESLPSLQQVFVAEDQVSEAEQRNLQGLRSGLSVNRQPAPDQP